MGQHHFEGLRLHRRVKIFNGSFCPAYERFVVIR